MKDCVFCKIVAGEIPSYKIYEDDFVLAFLDISNDAFGHTLIIPKRHYESLATCDEATLARVISAVKKVGNHYCKECGFDGWNLINNTGAAANQSVMHLHIHLVPRKAGDGLAVSNRIVGVEKMVMQNGSYHLEILPNPEKPDLKDVREKLKMPQADLYGACEDEGVDECDCVGGCAGYDRREGVREVLGKDAGGCENGREGNGESEKKCESGNSKNCVVLYTDGACSGNPGAGGWAAILRFGGREKVLSGGDANTTNNRMELMGVISGLEAVADGCGVPVLVHSDSAYVVNAFNNGWLKNWQQNNWQTASKGAVQNVDLWKRLLVQTARLNVQFVKVKGHSDVTLNNRCDALAREEIKRMQG